MKVLSQHINKKESKIVVQAEDSDDMWILYNLIQKGDRLKSVTHRIIQKEGTSKSEKVVVNLVIKVENIDYEKESASLRCKGRTVELNKYVPLGSYHTVLVDTKYSFTIFKDEIDSYSLKLLHDATHISNKAEIGAIVLQEGIAHFCLMTEFQRVLVGKVEKVIPKKRRGGSSGYDTAMEKFYGHCYNMLVSKFELDRLKVILIASPGTLAQSLLERIVNEASKQENESVMKARDKFVIAHSSSGYLQALDQTLKEPEVQQRLLDTRFMKQTLLLDQFFKALNDDTGKAFYGLDVCTKAVSIKGAVAHLLLTDTLFRSDDVKERKFFIDLSNKVRRQNGTVTIFSSLHDSGEQLDKMTGIAVLLNYPMPELEESSDEDE